MKVTIAAEKQDNQSILITVFLIAIMILSFFSMCFVHDLLIKEPALVPQLNQQAIETVSCKNEQGIDVDWWVILAMPRMQGNSHGQGEYFYCQSINGCHQLEKGEYLINQENSAFMRTFKESLSQPIQFFWNDQLSSTTKKSNHAHSKGFIASGGNTAIIINHSLPRFPIVDENMDISFLYPENTLIFGQHAFCLTTSLETAQTISQALIQARVSILYQRFDSKINEELKGLSQLSLPIPPTEVRSKMTLLIESLGGLKINMFAKHIKSDEELYSQIITPGLGVGMITETWAKGLETPICDKGQETISNLEITIEDFKYAYTKDHSKFAISIEESQPWVCFSDLNRQYTQIKRGGTAFCFQHTGLWGSLNSVMTKRQSCDK